MLKLMNLATAKPTGLAKLKPNLMAIAKRWVTKRRWLNYLAKVKLMDSAKH